MASSAAPNRAALLLAVGGKPKGMAAGSAKSDDEAAEGEAPAMDEVKRTAAEDAMAAFKSGDVDALSMALSDFVRSCKSEDY